MTLATRCSRCGTIFRVVQDQLRVSQGWVRCGRCGEAFNALESMVELPPPRIAPPAASDEPTSVQAPEPAPTADSSSSAGVPLDLPPGIELITSDGAVDPAGSGQRQELSESSMGGTFEADPAGAIAALESDPQGHDAAFRCDATQAATAAVDLPAPDAPAAPEDLAHAVEPIVPVAPADDLRHVAPPVQADDAREPQWDQPTPAAADRAPSFIVKADRAERWRRPGVRAALLLGAAIGLLGLGAQFVHGFRDRLAAAYPELRPTLLAACRVLDCELADVRQIDALSVESSALVRVEGSPVYRLTVTLRNRAAFEVAAPAMDLSLTDAQGKPIARRAFTMADLQLPLRTLKAGSELPIQVPLGIADRQVSGYTVEIFYP